MSAINGPRQVVLVTCRGSAEVMGRSEERDNIITVAWHMPVSHNPPMYAIAVGKKRFSAGLIRSSKCFAVNFIPDSMQDIALKCGTKSGIGTDKFKAFGIEKQDCSMVDCPKISNALGWIECELVNEVDAGDHLIFIGSVLKSSLVREGSRLFHIEGNSFTTTR